MPEISAKGVRGFLVHKPGHPYPIFRVNRDGNTFDYNVIAEHFEVEIIDGCISLIGKNVDYSSEWQLSG